eukprot:350174_1
MAANNDNEMMSIDETSPIIALLPYEQVHKDDDYKEETKNNFLENDALETDAIIEKFKIAVTFLLHSKSPLHDGNISYSFKNVCQMYNNQLNNDDEHYQRLLTSLNSFYSKSYEEQWYTLHKLWNKWRRFHYDGDIANTGFYQDVLMDEFCDEYLSNHRKFRITTLCDEVSTKNDVIRKIQSRDQMKQWLDYKMRAMDTSINELPDETESDKQPMFLWESQHVLSFVEEMDQCKHLAPVFLQYNINGSELCAMTQKQFELLFECFLLNNDEFDKNIFNDLKSNNDNQVDWRIAQHSSALKKLVDKTRIKQHIVSRYHLASDLLKHLLTERDYPHIQVEAQNIFELIQFLRTDSKAGPKHFWKIDSLFFHKIDNFLAVLLSPPRITQIFQKWFPDFLVDENKSYGSNKTDVQKRVESSRKGAQRYIPVSPDCLDKCMDVMCAYTACSDFFHNIDR